ncbi:unnamed protein product [Thlaspi arvense]|uniref:SWIM-type domain-containing protein n=1 Tax=Thlaspi arvense TaxID=13288 RepID=A0AAU9TBM3_THLAR|nr:unnamed protein product [Thlaspi arvense]
MPFRVSFMGTRKIPVFCYWNGCIKDGPDGPFYEGSRPRVMRVESKTNLPKLLDDLHRVTGFEKGKFQFELIGRYPCIVQQPMVKYVRLPIVDDSSLETMLEVPSYHSSINSLELYLEVKPVVSDGGVGKHSREDNNDGWLEEEESRDDVNCGNNEPVATKGLSDGVSKQMIFSSSWLVERELHVGMLSRDKEELKKAVKLCSARMQREYMWNAKKKAITSILGDSDKSFSVLPKLMAALCSSNKTVMDWQYDLCPNPKDASLRSVFWAFHQSIEGAGVATHIPSFDSYLKKIEKMNPEARKWLDKIPPHQWSLAHDAGGMRFGFVNTNTISVTYGFINKAPDLPVTTCILLIFDHLAELLKSSRGLISESVNRGDKYVERVMKRLEEYNVASRTHDVLPSEPTGVRFEVTVTEMVPDEKKRFRVHLNDRVCTCGIWQLCKHPCSHVLAVCRRINTDHLQYVNECYSTESYLQAYAAEFNPLPGVSDWPEAADVPRLFPPGSRRICCPASHNSATAQLISEGK